MRTGIKPHGELWTTALSLQGDNRMGSDFGTPAYNKRKIEYVLDKIEEFDDKYWRLINRKSSGELARLAAVRLGLQQSEISFPLT